MMNISEVMKSVTVNNSKSTKLQFVRTKGSKLVFVYTTCMFNLRVTYDKMIQEGEYEILPAFTSHDKYTTVIMRGCTLLKKCFENIELSEFLDLMENSIVESIYLSNGEHETLIFRKHVIKGMMYNDYIRYESERSKVVVRFPEYFDPGTCEVICTDIKSSENKYYTCKLVVKRTEDVKLVIADDENASV